MSRRSVLVHSTGSVQLPGTGIGVEPRTSA